jgi:hypothetical protein
MEQMSHTPVVVVVVEQRRLVPVEHELEIVVDVADEVGLVGVPEYDGVDVDDEDRMQEEVVGDGVVEKQVLVLNMSLLQLEGDERVEVVAWKNSTDQELQMNSASGH